MTCGYSYRGQRVVDDLVMGGQFVGGWEMGAEGNVESLHVGGAGID